MKTENLFLAVCGLAFFLLSILIGISVVTNRSAFSDCIAYGNLPAECASALD